MAYHGVLIPEAIAATNIDSLNRSFISSSAIDNGGVFVSSTKSTTDGEGEVFKAIVANTSGSPTGLWMAYSGDEIVVTDSRYKGIDPDPRNFFNAAGKVFSGYKPQLGDIILATTDAFSGAYSAGSTTHVNAADAAHKMAWATSQLANALSYKLIKVSYISLATGAIDNQRVAAYEFECVGL